MIEVNLRKSLKPGGVASRRGRASELVVRGVLELEGFEVWETEDDFPSLRRKFERKGFLIPLTSVDLYCEKGRSVRSLWRDLPDKFFVEVKVGEGEFREEQRGNIRKIEEVTNRPVFVLKGSSPESFASKYELLGAMLERWR